MWSCIFKESEDGIFKSSHMWSGMLSLVLRVYEPRPSSLADGSVLKQGDERRTVEVWSCSQILWHNNNVVLKNWPFPTLAFSCFAISMSPLDSFIRLNLDLMRSDLQASETVVNTKWPCTKIPWDRQKVSLGSHPREVLLKHIPQYTACFRNDLLITS